jgi:hypothetical protein
LVLIAAVTLISAQGFGAATETGQNSEDAAIADYFDGLRAWELKEEPMAAAIWLKAAEWGDVRAMQRVAELYEQGQVLPHDAALAFFWFSQAARSGSAPAKAAADRLRSQLSANELSNIEPVTASWRPKLIRSDGSTRTNAGIGDLLRALDHHDLRLLHITLSSGISPNISDSEGMPILFFAIAAKELDFLEILLSVGANADFSLPNGMTPLHIAAGVGDSRIVGALLEHGASSAIQDHNGAWAFEIAERKGFKELSQRLRSKMSEDVGLLRISLETEGYLADNQNFFNASPRLTAVRMFQKGRIGLNSTGYIDGETVEKAFQERKDNRLVHYYCIEIYKKANIWWWGTFKGRYATADDARAAAAADCRADSGRSCRVEVAPAGGCLAIAAAPGSPVRLSALMLTQSDASADALAKCAADGLKGCSIRAASCADAQ